MLKKLEIILTLKETVGSNTDRIESLVCSLKLNQSPFGEAVAQLLEQLSTNLWFSGSILSSHWLHAKVSSDQTPKPYSSSNMSSSNTNNKFQRGSIKFVIFEFMSAHNKGYTVVLHCSFYLHFIISFCSGKSLNRKLSRH